MSGRKIYGLSSNERRKIRRAVKEREEAEAAGQEYRSLVHRADDAARVAEADVARMRRVVWRTRVACAVAVVSWIVYIYLMVTRRG